MQPDFDKEYEEYKEKVMKEKFPDVYLMLSRNVLDNMKRRPYSNQDTNEVYHVHLPGIKSFLINDRGWHF